MPAKENFVSRFFFGLLRTFCEVIKHGMGSILIWLDEGGVNDQAAWVVDGFAVLAGVEAVMGPLPAISKTE